MHSPGAWMRLTSVDLNTITYHNLTGLSRDAPQPSPIGRVHAIGAGSALAPAAHARDARPRLGTSQPGDERASRR